MRTTCCRHCIDGCNGVSGVWMHAAQEQPAGEATPTAYVVWRDGGCPMRAEAERIAEAIYKKVTAGEDSLPVGSGKFGAGYISGLDDAAGIAAGIARGLRRAPEHCECCASDDIDVQFHGYRCRDCGGMFTLLPPRERGES